MSEIAVSTVGSQIAIRGASVGGSGMTLDAAVVVCEAWGEKVKTVWFSKCWMEGSEPT